MQKDKTSNQLMLKENADKNNGLHFYLACEDIGPPV